jgi:hypothetical protein
VEVVIAGEVVTSGLLDFFSCIRVCVVSGGTAGCSPALPDSVGALILLIEWDGEEGESAAW